MHYGVRIWDDEANVLLAANYINALSSLNCLSLPAQPFPNTGALSCLSRGWLLRGSGRGRKVGGDARDNRDTCVATTTADANSTNGQKETCSEGLLDSWNWRKTSFSCRCNWPNGGCINRGNEFASGKVRALCYGVKSDSTQTGSWTASPFDYLHTHYSLMKVQLRAGGEALSHALFISRRKTGIRLNWQMYISRHFKTK